MLLAVEGYFEAGRFVTDTPVHIPEGKRAIVTVLDEAVDKDKERKDYVAYWNKIIEDIQNSDEVLEGEPERIRFKTPEEIDAL
jgi:hypothetical protein